MGITAAILLALAGITTSVIGGVISAKNQKEANDTNRMLADAANAANSAEAEKNRDFELMMSSTAHQREVEDLKAAGLNPWLSVSGTGAPVVSTPTAVNSAASVKSVGDFGLSDVASIAQSVAFMAALNAGRGANSAGKVAIPVKAPKVPYMSKKQQEKAWNNIFDKLESANIR